MRVKRYLLLAALMLLLAPAGCIFSPGDTPEPPPEADPLPPATTKLQLMENFQTVYKNRDYKGYLKVVDPSFKIYLLQSTIDDYSLPQEFFDYDQDSQITYNMFSGNAIQRGDVLVPGITGISMTLNQTLAWATSPADDKIPDAEWAPYDVEIIIDQGSKRLKITGTINFYVKGFQENVNGTTKTIYRMVGQVDNTEPST